MIPFFNICFYLFRNQGISCKYFKSVNTIIHRISLCTVEIIVTLMVRKQSHKLSHIIFESETTYCSSGSDHYHCFQWHCINFATKLSPYLLFMYTCIYVHMMWTHKKNNTQEFSVFLQDFLNCTSSFGALFTD